jgi:hypothetical protein
MMRLETPLLVHGRGPAALVAAKVAGSCGQPCLLVGHEITSGDAPVELDATATDVLEQHGLVDVLRPHLLATDPLTVVPRDFEHVLKQHCVADLNVVVYDQFDIIELAVEGRSLRGLLSNGTSTWDLAADTWIDADALAGPLPAAIRLGAAAALDAIVALRS